VFKIQGSSSRGFEVQLLEEDEKWASGNCTYAIILAVPRYLENTRLESRHTVVFQGMAHAINVSRLGYTGFLGYVIMYSQ